MTNLEEIKKEIDTSKNEKIELHEMEEFLQSDENIKRLWDAMESSLSSELLEEYKYAIWEFCDKIMKMENKKLTLNQFNILSFYFKHFNEENWKGQTYNKVKKILENLYKKYYKEYDKYLKGKWEKPTGPVAEYFENLQQEKLDELKKMWQEFAEQLQLENSLLIKRQKEEEERMNKLLDRWENDKKEIENILQKEWIITEEEIRKVLYFRDFYYKEWHILYKRDNIDQEIYNQLSKELWESLMHNGIIGYDEIARKIDEVEKFYNIVKEIDSESQATEWELSSTISNLESLWIRKNSKLIRKTIKNDIKTLNDINTTITKESIKKYIQIPQNVPEENYEYIAENIKILLSNHLSLNPWRKSLIFWWDATWMNIEKLYQNINYETNLHKELQKIQGGNIDTQIQTLTKQPINTDLLEIWLKTTINKDNWKNTLSKLYNNIPLKQSTSFFSNYNNRHKDSCINLQDYRLFRIQELWKKDIDSQVNTIITLLPTNHEFLELWLKATLNSKKYNQESVLSKLFDKTSSSTFFQICSRNTFINELKNNYALYWLNKNNSINTDNKTYCFLDWQNKSKFDSFYGKWIKISEELTFDELYERTKNFYEWLKTYNISPKIPIPNILEFYDKVKKLQPRLEQIKKQYGKSMWEVSKMRNDPIMNIWSPTIWWWYGSWANLSEQSTKRIFDRDKAKIMTDIAEAYAKLLLNDPTMRWKKITAPKEFWWFTLDFSRTTPEAVVRNSFSENFEDQRNLFLYNMKNDRQAAFWSFLWMVWWIWWAAFVGAFTQNIWATSAWFTAWLRLWNWIWQELWNSWEYLYEQISWKTINDWNNKVENFWQWFLRWVWALDENYEYVWTNKFLSWLTFDYLSTVATFWLSQKFWWFLQNLEWVKFAWGALKFWMEELILENFFVDIPMNIVQTWFEAFTWIDNWWVTVWNTAIWNQRTITWEKPYESGSLSDMLRAMKDATQQNLSFENLSQTFFNTVIYGWFLEWWWAAIKKVKWYLPAWQVSIFTEKSAAAAAAFTWLTNFMNTKNINFNKDWKCIDIKTNQEITEIDPRFQELRTHLNAVNATKAWVIESFQTLMDAQRQMVADPENRTWLLFRLWLISSTNTPLNILKKKKKLVEKRLENARKKWDKDTEKQLQKLLDIYTDAEQKLSKPDDNIIDSQDKESKRFELSNFKKVREEKDIPGNFTSVMGEFFIPSLGKTGFYKKNGCMMAAKGDEDLRELISSKLLDIIGFPHADIILTQDNQLGNGALSVNILSKDEEFVEVDTYNIPGNEKYDLDGFIERDLKIISTIPGVDSKILADRKDYLIKYIMISAFIGNTDLKMDNMSMIRNKKTGELRNAEYYDMWIAFNNNPYFNRFFQRYSPEDIIRELYEKYPDQAMLYGKEIERNLTQENINNIVNEEIFDGFDPDVREYIRNQLKERIKLIRQLNKD